MKINKELEIYREAVNDFTKKIENGLYPNYSAYGDNPFMEVIYEIEDFVPKGKDRDITITIVKKYMNGLCGAIRDMKI